MSMRYFIACLGLVLTIAHCQSTQSRSRDVFSSILADAENLRVNRSGDVAKYQSLVDRLTQLRSDNETYATDADNAARAAAFLGGYPSLKCAVAFGEPEETLLVARGYASPVKLESDCNVDSPFLFEADSAALTLAPADVEFKDGHMVARIRVNAASMTSAKNVIEISGHYYVEGLLRQVQKDFELEATPSITFEPASFTLKGQPVATTRAEPVKTTTDTPQKLAEIEFRRDSMQLSTEARRLLIALKLHAGNKVRIRAFAGKETRDPERLANLRARAIESFLHEQFIDIGTKIEWHVDASKANTLAIVEGTN